MSRYSEPMTTNNGGYLHTGTSPTSSPTMLHNNTPNSATSYMMGMHNNYSTSSTHHGYYTGSGSCPSGSPAPTTTYLAPPMVQATLLYPHLYNQNQIHLHLHGDSSSNKNNEIYPTSPPHDEVTIVTSTSNITISGSRAIEAQPPQTTHNMDQQDQGPPGPEAHDTRYSVADRQTDPSVWRPY